MKLAQSRVHAVRLSLGPINAFAWNNGHREPRRIIGDTPDVVLQKVKDIVEVVKTNEGDDKEVILTDGAGLVGRSVLKAMVKDYKRRNPGAYVNPNLCAFQGEHEHKPVH